MTPRTRIAAALLWLALLTLAGWLLSSRMELTGDLRKFMPARLSNRRAPKSEAARAASRPVATTGVRERCKPRPRLAIVEALT